MPFVLVLKISFAELRLGIPPYTELLSFKDGVVQISLIQLGTTRSCCSDDLYFATYISSLKMAAVSTFFAC